MDDMTEDDYIEAALNLAKWFRSNDIDETQACVVMAGVIATIIKVGVAPDFRDEVMDAFTGMLRAGLKDKKEKMQ